MHGSLRKRCSRHGTRFRLLALLVRERLVLGETVQVLVVHGFTLVQGAPRRRVFLERGASVDALCRERIGGLSLADLPALAAEGSVVEATERELQLLRSMLRPPAAPARIESTAASHAA